MQSKILRRAEKLLPLCLAAALFILLTVQSAAAGDAARKGLHICARVIIPSLLPFFVLSNLLSALGLSRALARLASKPMRKFFRISGAGASAFLIGLTGGYPLGAATAAELYRRRELREDEAKRLICFCNNTGPAFIIGAAGSGVFGSAKAGLLLYAAHVLAAIMLGLLFSLRSKVSADSVPTRSGKIETFSEAFPNAVSAAVRSTLIICGYVVFFSVITGLLDALALFSSLSGLLAVKTPLGLGQTRALLSGFLELGSGVATLLGLPPTAENLAICAFILSWGGLSVQFQTRAVLSGTPLVRAPLFISKLLHGMIAAALAYTLAFLF